MTTSVDNLLFSGVITGALNWIFTERWSLFQDKLPYLVQKENGFAAFNTKNATAYNEYYEIKTGADDHMEDYYEITRWGKYNTSDEFLWDNLTLAEWWDKDGGYLVL